MSGAVDNTVRTWDAVSGAQLNVMDGHSEFVNTVSFHPDLAISQIVSGSDDETIRVWDVTSGTAVRTIQVDEKISAVAYSPDGKRLLSVSRDSDILNLWDTSTGSKLAVFQQDTPTKGCSGIQSAAFSFGGSMVVTAHKDNNARIWDSQSGAMLGNLEGHKKEVIDAVFTADGKRVVSVSNDTTVRAWSVGTGECIKIMEGHSSRVLAIAVSKTCIASGGSGGIVHLWDVDSYALLSTLTGHTDYVRSLSFSPDGTQLVSASYDQTLRLWDTAATGSRSDAAHTDAIECVAFSADGKRIATASWDSTITIWETQTGRRLRTLRGHTSEVFAVAFSPDRQQLVSGGSDKVVRVWNAETGELHMSLDGHKLWILAVAWSPDGMWIASSEDVDSLMVRIWSASDGQPLVPRPTTTNASAVGNSEAAEDRYNWELPAVELYDQSARDWISPHTQGEFEYKDDWIISTQSQKRVCWLAASRRPHQTSQQQVACYGRLCAIGADSGQLTILDLSNFEQ